CLHRNERHIHDLGPEVDPGPERPLKAVPRNGFSYTETRSRYWPKFGARFSAKAVTPSLASGVSPKLSRPVEATLPVATKCSVSVFNDCFRKRSAVGDITSISSAHLRTSDFS